MPMPALDFIHDFVFLMRQIMRSNDVFSACWIFWVSQLQRHKPNFLRLSAITVLRNLAALFR